MSACPTCGKPVDPLRAPAVLVRAGKVISFCSKDCASAAETKPTAVPKTVPPAEAAAAAAPAPAPAPAAKKERAKTPVPIAMRRTPAGGIATSGTQLDSGPVIEILHEPASGVVASSPDARSGRAAAPASHTETDGAIQVAETGHLDDYVTPGDSLEMQADAPRRSRTGLVLFLLFLAIIGGGIAAYQLGYLDKLLNRSHAHTATKATPPPTPAVVEPARPPDPPPAAADAPLERAKAALRRLVHEDTPRIQKPAAAALARTGDAEALETLAAALVKDQNDIARLDCAYALMRAGDKRGESALVKALAAERRDIRLEAARRLALLGDTRAAPVLVDALAVSQLRLGAAEQLANLADPKAIEVLDKLRGDAKTGSDDHKRAIVALARAGQTDVAEELRGLLGDAHWSAFAAAELATMHDEAARSALEHQLGIGALRVSAARALRRLDAKHDESAQLAMLAAALERAKDTEQVQLAEAILVLAGPVEWSAHE